MLIKISQIVDIIRHNVENKLSLQEVHNKICETLNVKQLSNVDIAFIDRKYIKFCFGCFNVESQDILKSCIIEGNINELYEFLQQPKFHLKDLPDAFQQSDYYQLLCVSGKCNIYENIFKQHVASLKKEFVNIIQTSFKNVELEVTFLNLLVDVIFERNLETKFVASAGITDFVQNNGTLKSLIDTILKYFGDESVSITALEENLKEACQALQHCTTFLLENKIREKVKECFLEVRIVRKSIGDRNIIEVIGQCIRVSESIKDIESRLNVEQTEVASLDKTLQLRKTKSKFTFKKAASLFRMVSSMKTFDETKKISEVRFIGIRSITVDCNLSRDIWHGKNIVILTKKLIVDGNFTWDVSGTDSEHTYKESAINSSNNTENGQDGEDGFAGQSGGNVLVEAEFIEKNGNFTIASNGGRGSHGQNGGNGFDGKDGKGIDYETFCDYFPHGRTAFVLVYTGNELIRYNRRQKIIAKIKELCNSVSEDSAHTHYEGTTSDGAKITFSRYTSVWLPYQEYVIYQGSKGESASNGGLGAYGGKGGYEGEISVSDAIADEIVIVSKEGENGADGEGGKNGKPGTDGWDIAYTDYEYHYSVTYYGKSDKCKFDLSFHSDSKSNRIYCDKKSSYLQIDERKIKTITGSTSASKKSAIATQQRQQHSNSKRQKSISKSSILENYSSKFNSSEKFSLDLSKSSKLLKAILNADTSYKAQTREKVTRQLTHTKQNIQNKSIYKAIEINVKQQNNFKQSDITKFQKQIGNNLDVQKLSLVLSDVLEVLKNKCHEISQIKETKHLIEDIQKQYNDSKIISKDLRSKFENVENILLNKLKLAVLSDMASRNNVLTKVPENIKNGMKIVVLRNVEETEFAHIKNESFGKLVDFFNKNSDEKYQNLREVYENISNIDVDVRKVFIDCMIYYILIENSTNKTIIKYRKKFEKFVLEKDKNMAEIWFNFCEALRTEENTNIDQHSEDEQIECRKLADKRYSNLIAEKPSLETLKSICMEKKSLEKYVAEFDSINTEKFQWDKALSNNEVKKAFKNDVLDKGVTSDIYLSLLCKLFNSSITFYARNERNQYEVFKTVNINAASSIHMTNDHNYVQIVRERVDFMCNQLYFPCAVGNILIDLSQLKNFEQIEKYNSYEKYACISNIEEFYFANFINLQAIEETCLDFIINTFDFNESLKRKIENLKSEVIGKNCILFTLAIAFQTQGFLISNDLFQLILLEIMKNAASEASATNYFAWMFATTPQHEWLNHVVRIQVLNKQELTDDSQIEKYINCIKSNDVLVCLLRKVENIENLNQLEMQVTLELLSSTYDLVTVEELYNLPFKHWTLVLWKYYWQKCMCSIVSFDSKELETSLYYLNVIQNICGSDSVKCLFSKFNLFKQKVTSKDIVNILRVIFNGDCDVSFVIEKMTCECEMSKVIAQVTNTADSVRNNFDILSILKSNSNNCVNVVENITTTENFLQNVEKMRETKLCIQNFCYSKLEEDKNDVCIIVNYINETPIKMYKDEPKGKFSLIMKVIQSHFYEQIVKNEFDVEIFTLIDQAIFITRKFYLRYTQRIASHLLYSNIENTLAQVNTGEGKSLIVVSLAIMKAIRGEKVDVITCSRLLATRDAESESPKGYKDVFNMFGINVSHNCSENIEERIQAYSGNQIVYGDIGSFQRDYLLDRFYGKNIIGDRNFENVIIDEVDSMLLDKGNNMLYLSQDVAGLEMVEPIFLNIWQTVNSSHGKNDIQSIKTLIISKYFYKFDYKELKIIDNKFTESDMKELLGILKTENIVHGNGDVNINQDLELKLDACLNEKFICYKSRLVFYLKLITKHKTKETVPQSLKKFIYLHIEKWIENAITAALMKEGTDYIVDVDRTDSTPDRNPMVTIIDNDTGTDQSNSQWENGLHQFLQLKHGCRLSRINLKAVFISNVNYFKMYKKVHGLSGTLGSEVERNFLKGIHKVDFVSVPTAKIKQYEEYTPIICKSAETYFENIYKESIKIALECKRAVLIICENILSAENLHSYFTRQTDSDAKYKLYLYKRDFEEFAFAQGNAKLEPCSVIIATNLAGRGTDIKLSDQVLENGGLHVCVSFFPPNLRVEQQAFGRASRCGEPGSGRLIFKVNDDNDNITQIKSFRETCEAKHVSMITYQFKNNIKVEEKLFSKFQLDYSELRKIIKDLKTKYQDKAFKEICNIILKAFVELWSLWLDDVNINRRNNDDTMELYQSFKKICTNLFEFVMTFFKLDDNNRQKPWISMLSKQNLSQIIHIFQGHITNNWLMNVASVLIKSDKFTNAAYIYDEIIMSDFLYSEHAQYYKARVILNTINDWKKMGESDKKKLEIAILHLKQASDMFQKRHAFCIQFASCASEIEQRQQVNHVQIIKIDALKQQKVKESMIYSSFLESIQNMIGKPISHEDFIIDKIDESLSKRVFDQLIHEKIVSKLTTDISKIKDNVFEFAMSCIDTTVSEIILKKYFLVSNHEITFQKVSNELSYRLPNANEFWEILSLKDLLKDENHYIAIDLPKLTNIDPSLATRLSKIVESDKKLFSYDAFENFDHCKYMFDGINPVNLKDKVVMLKSKFEKFFGSTRLDCLEKLDAGAIQLFKHATLASLENKTSQIHKFYSMELYFNKYDSITKEEFIGTGSDSKCFKEIFDELVKQQLLVVDSSNEELYRLGSNFISIRQAVPYIDQLMASRAMNLINYHFAYRIEFESLILQMMDKSRNVPIKLKIERKPEIRVIYEMLAQGFMMPSNINPYLAVDMKDKFEKIFPSTYDGTEILNMLRRHGVHISVSEEELLNELLEKKWISYRHLGVYIYNLSGTIDYMNTKWRIENLEIEKEELSILQDEQDTIKKVLSNLYLLSNAYIQKEICGKISYMSPKLHTLKSPSFVLDNLLVLEHEKFREEDLDYFNIRGLTYLMSVEESNYSWKTILCASAVIALGLIEIGVSVYTAVTAPNISKVCMSEGISDIFYGCQALWSGKFSLKDYAQHKAISLMTSIAITGVSNWGSTSNALSSANLPANAFDPAASAKGGLKLCEMSGKEIAKFVGMKKIAYKAFENVAKQVAYKIKSMALPHIIEHISTNYLIPVCNWISSYILTFLDFFKFSTHAIWNNFSIFCVKHGTEAMSLFKRYLTEIFEAQSFMDTISKYISQYCSPVFSAINSVRTDSKYGKIFAKIQDFIKLIMEIQSIVKGCFDVKNLAQSLLFYVDQLNKKIEMDIKDFKVVTDDEKKTDSKRLIEEAECMLKLRIQEKATKFIQEKFIKPLLTILLTFLANAAEKYAKNKYISYRENKHIKEYERLTEKFKNDVENENLTDDQRDDIKEAYDKNMEDLMKKTRSPKLYAMMIKDSAQIDITGAKCACQVIASMPELVGKNVKFVIKSEGMQQEIESKTEGDEIVIVLDVENNHFSKGNNAIDNNCFFAAVESELRNKGIELACDEEELRTKTADYVLKDPEIQLSIENGWQDLAISKGAIGGAARYKVENLDSEEQQKHLEEIFNGDIVTDSKFKNVLITEKNEDGSIKKVMKVIEYTSDRRKIVYNPEITKAVADAASARYANSENEFSPDSSKKNSLYLIKSKDESDPVTYVGKTERSPNVREGEHAKKFEKEVTNKDTSYIPAKQAQKKEIIEKSFKDEYNFDVIYKTDVNVRPIEVIFQNAHKSSKKEGGMSHF